MSFLKKIQEKRNFCEVSEAPSSLKVSKVRGWSFRREKGVCVNNLTGRHEGLARRLSVGLAKYRFVLPFIASLGFCGR